MDPEAYLELLELNPRCPLYLGSYQFPEPATCSAAGVSDRNQYMLEIGNVYRHFGFEIAGELPDYLPAMTEFLALSCGCEDADAELRKRFIERLMLARNAHSSPSDSRRPGAIYAPARAGPAALPRAGDRPRRRRGGGRAGARPSPPGRRAKVVTID